MKVLILTLTVCVLACAGDINPNIPVDTGFGRPSYVEPEKLLEAALYPHLTKLGIYDIDVDDVYYERAVFNVQLVSNKDLGPNLKETLSKILRSDLGLDGVTVKDSPNQFNWGNFFGARSYSFTVSFNPQTFVSQMRPLASKIFANTYLSLEDSLWD